MESDCAILQSLAIAQNGSVAAFFFLPHIQKTVIPVHRHRNPFYNNDKIKQVLGRSPKRCKERMVAWRERKRRLNRFAYELVVFFPP